MPIRRAPPAATTEKTDSDSAEKEPEAFTEDSPPADEDQAASSAAAAVADDEAAGEKEPLENGEEKTGEDVDEGAAAEKDDEGEEKKDDKCEDCAAGQCTKHCYVSLKRLKDGYKYEKSKTKKVKRTIPVWASVSSNKKVPVTNYAGTQHRIDHILIEALTSFKDKSGVSYQSVMKYIMKKYPGMDEKKFLIRKAMKKHLEKGTIKQLKGKGLSGTFTIGKQTSVSKKGAANKESLGDALPLIITRLCEPKEASFILIKKYLEQHFPSFNIEHKPDVLKTALVKAVERGQLEQITGKGARGTFQLKRTGNKVLPKGGPLENAIVVAITAMNEPKTCSTTTLRKYLVDANKDRKEYQLVSSLRRTLTKCKVLGWMEQITGHGFTGTYQLCFPYYPSPNILYPDEFKEPSKKNASTPTRRRRRTVETSDEESEEEEEEEEDEEEEEEEESDEEEVPVKRATQRRPPPKVRRPPPPKKSRSASQTKTKGKARALAKKSPAKKPAPPARKSGGKKAAAPAKKAAAPAKKAAASPVKRGAPAGKPKTPAAKKLKPRGSRQRASEDTSEEEEEEEEEEEVAPAKPAARGASKRSKPEESTPEEPPAKKQATKSAPAKSKAGSAAKRGAKKGGGKPPARKTKRGRK